MPARHARRRVRSSTKAGGGSASSHAPIKVLAITDPSGPTKVYGAVQIAALNGAADYDNAHGGIMGHKVQITIMDDKYDAHDRRLGPGQGAAGRYADRRLPRDRHQRTSALDAMLECEPNVFAIALNDGQHTCERDAATKFPSLWTLSNPTIDQDLTVAAGSNNGASPSS